MTQELGRPGARLGRPRDAGLTDRLLTGALDLVAEVGLDRFNADALVTATGAGKAAVYRRWPNTEVLLAEALRRCHPVPAVPDTGSLRGDLVALLAPWTRAMDRDERALAAVVGQARHSEELRVGLQVAVVEPLDAAVTAVVDRHAARGHRVSDRQGALLRRLVLALWWDRSAADPAPRTAAEVGELVDRVLLPVVPVG
ncbi:TetR-like C-terminal domain-containing protein [Klenkia terrae]|uniref:TetR-like C-terminal domain-containing protein n=1 Tax=Klenkia terrae TaxID=1052259 RepID=A0ABU8E898_9ACTN|nr:TetR-like C-terminal domain-containing protein [Klenkia terrae]